MEYWQWVFFAQDASLQTLIAREDLLNISIGEEQTPYQAIGQALQLPGTLYPFVVGSRTEIKPAKVPPSLLKGTWCFRVNCLRDDNVSEHLMSDGDSHIKTASVFAEYMQGLLEASSQLGIPMDYAAPNNHGQCFELCNSARFAESMPDLFRVLVMFRAYCETQAVARGFLCNSVVINMSDKRSVFIDGSLLSGISPIQ